MKFDLFVSDFDGTLGTIPDIIEEDNVNAIKEYTAKGGKFVICTGRMKNSIRPICLKYGLKGLVISYQGAMISDIETDKCLFKGGIDYQLAADLARRLEKEDLPLILHKDDYLYYEKTSELIQYYEQATKTDGIKVDNIADFILKEKSDIFKYCIICGEKKVSELAEKYNKIYGDKLIFNSGSPWIMEIINPTLSKGFAVKFLADYYKVPYEKVITVGDSTNDIPLLCGEWHGVAVGDGMETLKAVADEVTVPYSQKPVAHLLKKYCL